MEQKIKVTFIIHCSLMKGKAFINLLGSRQKIDKKKVNFEFPSKNFNKFKYYHPSILLIINSLDIKIGKYTLNLIIGTNTYHIFSYGNQCLFELLFYNEKNLTIFADKEEIKEYDVYGKFTKVSFINVPPDSIIIKNTKLCLNKFLPNRKGNSFQLSFYDIQQKYIAVKRIIAIKNMNFRKFYNNNIYFLENFSNYIDILENINCEKVEFEEKQNNLMNCYSKKFQQIEQKLNLFLPKSQLEKILYCENYLSFFYYFAKMKLFQCFYICEDNNLENFIKLYKYYHEVFSEIKEKKNLKIFEKITILLGYASIFSKYTLCENYLKANIYYVKIEDAENNSVIRKSMNFLNYYINGLNEESPSYFNLIEINSGIGYYRNEAVFTYDIISLDYLKNHLKESLPSVIIFYNEKKE